MQRFYINGGRRLKGRITIDTAKNALLPILAGCIMVDGVTTLESATRYSDIDAMCDILSYLGASTMWQEDNLIIDTTDINGSDITLSQSSKLRASIFALGPLLGRQKIAKVAYPGGCDIGVRPIDIHISGLKQLGAHVIEKNGFIYANGKNMRGGDIALSFPSVGATENLMMAAVLIKGTTRLFNVAKEPEIVDLQNFLNACGAKITGAGSEIITIEGVKRLNKNVVYRPISDRIIAGTHMLACAICGGKITLNNVNAKHNEALISYLRKSACQFDIKNDKITMKSQGRLKSFGEVETAIYPGVPTDLQAQIMALQCVSEGSCMIVENLFESRFKHVPELIKLGADIRCKGSVCFISGKEKLYGAAVKAKDLRGGAGLVLAGLVAEGYTTIEGIGYIDRGYYKLEEQLRALGADIIREEI